MTDKIIPCIWYHTDDGSMQRVIEYYSRVFSSQMEAGEVISLGETPGGYTEMAEVSIYGQRYTLMSTSEVHHPLNDAVSFVIHCEDQQEIDHIWNYFTEDGQESQCGWCIDKFGIMVGR